ncbi:hypothetical protein BGZ46_007876 [Entomortierella lignicola]|nr:hypothetical protein BGZ46_007876 [Entomortierella lignicola]
MSRDVFALPPSGLPVKEVLELANLQLESARKANTTEKVLILCDLAKELLKDAENILVKIQTHNLDLANAYHNHGVLQEEVGNSYEAKKSYRKAERWGYVRVTSESTDSSQVTNPSDTVLGLDIGPSVHQDVANDATSTEVKNQMSAISKVATPIQAKVVRQDLSTQSIKITLPGPFERIVSTSQLAYCLSLLASEEGFNKNECDWLQATKGDPDEQKRLTTIATDIIRAFVREDFKTSGVVAEAVSLAAILEQDDFRKLLRIFVNEIDKPLLLKENLLNGLAHLIKNAKPGNIYSGDLVKILELLSARLKDTHAQSLQHIYRLTVTVTSVLDSMVDAQVDNLKREQLHTPLSQHLKSLQKSSDPCLVYYAAYSYQALQHIPDDETFLKATIRRTGKIVKGISGVYWRGNNGRR